MDRRFSGEALVIISKVLDSMSISRFGIKCAMHDGLVSHAKLFSWLLCKDFQVVEFLSACSFVDGGSRGDD